MTEEKTLQSSSEDKHPAKTSSLGAQIAGAIWIAIWCGYKFIQAPANITVTDVILSGAGIAACFMPVYFNLIMDKIKDIKSA